MVGEGQLKKSISFGKVAVVGRADSRVVGHAIVDVEEMGMSMCD